MCAIDFEPVIATERLRLRKPRKADAVRLAQHANDFDVSRMTTGMPYPYGLDHAEGFLAQVSEQDPAREAVFVIEHPDHGAIGVMGFDGPSIDETELGYWLGRPYWGAGFATEAAQRTSEILECHMVAGGFDYLIKARVSDMEAYRRFLGEVLVAMPGVRETRTYAVLEEVKSVTELPV